MGNFRPDNRDRGFRDSRGDRGFGGDRGGRDRGFGGGRGGFSGRDRRSPEMHQVTCTKCGQEC